MIDIHAIARHYGGTVTGGQALIPTPGHSSRDRGTAIKPSARNADGVVVCCYNGARTEALDVKAMLRRDGFLPGQRRELSRAERRSIVDAARREETARLAKHREAGAKALAQWRDASQADPSHPYLIGKALAPFGIRQHGNTLLIPMLDSGFRLWNLQRIHPEGRKLFMAGARTAGLFWPHGLHLANGTASIGPVVIAEGFATAAAIYEASGFAVVAAMSERNLLPTALAIRALFPDRALIVAADHDGHLSRNVGLEAARESAEAVGGVMASPLGFDSESDSAARKIDFADIPRPDAAALIVAASRKGGDHG